LHIAIHGFVLEEVTKPVHERDLQVLLRSQALIPSVYLDSKALQHLTAIKTIYTLIGWFPVTKKIRGSYHL